jgi:hypothetical protein
MKANSLTVFEGKQIRRYYDESGTEWGQIFILESGKNAQEEKRRTCGHKVNLIIRERCQ